MKKLLVALLSLGLIVAFAMTASAQPSVKFSGQYYVVGVYEDNRGLSDTNRFSRAFLWTRTRIQTDFQIAEGLMFTTRFDAFEKQWGAVNRSSSLTEDKSNSGRVTNTNVTLQENIEMEYGYVTFMTRIGKFEVGYQAADEWGTVFGDIPGSRPRAKFTTVFGPLTFIAAYEKVFEADVNSWAATTNPNTPSGITDGDQDNYVLAGVYSWTAGNAGILFKYINGAVNRPTANFKTERWAILPYLKGTFGPVYVESEVIYLTGKHMKYDAGGNNVDAEGLGAYLLARLNIGAAYVGGQFGYSSGNDTGNGASGTISTNGKDKSGPVSTTSWVPCLIFANSNLNSWQYASSITGGVGGQGGVPTYGSGKQNLVLYNIFAGINVTPKINIEVAYSMMNADQTPAGYPSKNYGSEADIKATYKIYDNLTYMLGAGYFITGDFFKGASGTVKTTNEYLLMNQLTLNF
jgi:hypothetical protein